MCLAAVHCDDDALSRDGKEVLGVQREFKLSQELVEMFNDTAVELLRRSFEVKQPTSLQGWTNIRGRRPELHNVLGNDRRSTELAVGERELRPNTFYDAAQHDPQLLLSVRYRRSFELLHSFRSADKVEGGNLVSEGLIQVVGAKSAH